jgi:ectoine hydroxylase-related dioxygenase (phytanoyl-CoA dioxygenase family)
LELRTTVLDYHERYRRDGAALIEAVFTAQEVDGLRAAAFMALTELAQIRAAGYRHNALETVKYNGNEAPALLFWPSLANRKLDAFRTDRRLRAIVSELLGPDIKQLNNQLYYRLPGDGDSFAWHQDIMFRAPLDEYPGIVENDAYLQTAIVVDAMNPENGGVEFVLGSHRLGDLGLVDVGSRALRGFDRTRNAAAFAELPTRIFEAEPGDVLIWSSLTVHGSEPNRSDQHRMYYVINPALKGRALWRTTWNTKLRHFPASTGALGQRSLHMQSRAIHTAFQNFGSVEIGMVEGRRNRRRDG